ncbi:MAG: hypothetical protein KGN78_04960 [Actinomycetales bacterium]|nr:hypothetical protein [Actinomycetales bacterium]
MTEQQRETRKNALATLVADLMIRQADEHPNLVGEMALKWARELRSILESEVNDA